MTEVTTEPQLSPFDIKKQEANNKISDMTMDDIAGYIATLQLNLEERANNNSAVRGRLQKLVDTVETFIKDNLKTGADADDLKELAEKLDIELVKDVTISFTVNYTAEITVPIDFNIEDIDESDFNVNIEFQGNNDDIEWDTDSSDIEDFEVEEA